VTKRLVYSGASTAGQLQQFLEANVYHRQGMLDVQGNTLNPILVLRVAYSLEKDH